MSSSEKMIDPSVELEKKAEIVEKRIESENGIEVSSEEYFKRWGVLPQKSYLRNNQKEEQNIQRLKATDLPSHIFDKKQMK